MPKLIPVVGDYCTFTDREGERIGRIIAEKDSDFIVKYHYDAFTGYILVREPKDNCAYIKPVGVKIDFNEDDIAYAEQKFS